eukprot:6439817-Heterocapsa_arctica.AAC.1
MYTVHGHRPQDGGRLGDGPAAKVVRPRRAAAGGAHQGQTRLPGRARGLAHGEGQQPGRQQQLRHPSP